MEETPRVYVGTYAKYNVGNLHGAWIELTTKEAYEEQIKELHKDEEDPEYMIQDAFLKEKVKAYINSMLSS